MPDYPVFFDLEYVETPAGVLELQAKYGDALGVDLTQGYYIITYPDRFTCEDCRWGAICPYSFDFYNTDGDCLASK